MRLLMSRGARQALELEEPSSDALADSFREARVLSTRLESALPSGANRLSAGALHALGRLERALRAYLDRFVAQRDSDLLLRALAELDRRFGPQVVDRLLNSFEADFLPPRSEPIPEDPELASLRRQELLAGLLVLSIVHANPAGARVVDVLHSGSLVGDPEYPLFVASLGDFLDQVPGPDSESETLLESLRRPIAAAPDSIEAQLRWVMEHWLQQTPRLEAEIVSALDLIQEEQMPRFAPGPGPSQAPSFDHLDPSEVHYGTDRAWMSELVLVAKNIHVWLDQLSNRYGQVLTRLDQIPDTALETLANRGINGLWLIGIWERSRASRKIKQLCGNPEAAGSAYSLLAYRIAPELGGAEALVRLEERAGRFGIRLSADMVPNHTGIDSEWLIERPELFVSVPVCPFPSYTFEGPDLSSDRRVGIYLEDHYYDRTDAAVVFKRVDRETGQVAYVYHGNDGTGTPWNDTAQLDYLNPATREAVIETILEVAKMFPILRFDAAMTLANRHIHRLWHPAPGSAGAIPSRAEHAMESDEFDARMPREFWREVVDRAESEAPGTLLLAEAFWLMEGYFVRNLGLHRVYNSAFMHMLRDHDNSGYRKLVRECLDFDPEILRRYVNFLSNPDEKSALEQFGSGDRYFGACVLLATMPGLPLFAHGQIEGLSERYGMEYRRAYVDEEPDPLAIERHERQIVPLLRDRGRFASVGSFEMHDFTGLSGALDENILAISHGVGEPGGRSVVVFNNQSRPVQGLLKVELDLETGASAAPGRLCRFRDRLSRSHFLRPVPELSQHGLALELGAYESLVLEDFRELEATDEGGIYARLSRHLGLRGTPSCEETARRLHLAEARSAFGEILATLALASPLTTPALLAIEEQLEELEQHLRAGLEPEPRDSARPKQELAEPVGPLGNERSPSDLPTWLEAISRLAAVEKALEWPRTRRMLGALELLTASERQREAGILLPAFALMGLVRERWGATALGALQPGSTALEILRDRGLGAERESRLAAWIDVAALDGWLETAAPPGREEARRLLERAAGSESAARILGYDPERGTLERGALREFLTWRATAAALAWLATSNQRQDTADAVVGWCDGLSRLAGIIQAADMRLQPVLERL